MDELLLGLAAALSFLFGWNNSSFLIGNIRGSGTLSYAAAASVSTVGLLLGVLLEGSKMAGSLAGSLPPSTTDVVLLATVGVSTVLTLALTLLGLPVSFSMVMVGAFLGSTLASALAINVSRSGVGIAFWFLAPVVSALLTFIIYGLVSKSVSGVSLLGVDSLNRAGAIASALAVSYTLGANNVGLIYDSSGAGSLSQAQQSVVFLSLALAAVFGMLALGRGALRGTIGDRMLSLTPQGVFSAFIASSLIVWLGTQLAIPVSISQCLLGAMFGAAFTKNVTVLNMKLVRETISVWLVAPLVSFATGYALVTIL
jgi:PiT family inorganic phosphate transporter